MRSVRSQTPDVAVVENQSPESHAEGTATEVPRDRGAAAESSDATNLLPRVFVDGESGSGATSSSSPITLSLDPAVRHVFRTIASHTSTHLFPSPFFSWSPLSFWGSLQGRLM